MVALVLVISVLSLGFAGYLAGHVLGKGTGTEAMQNISNAIREGAEAFLSRQNRTIGMFALVLGALIFLLYAFVRTPSSHDPVGPVELAFWTTLSFGLGAVCSIIAGYVGMWVSIRSTSDGACA